MGFGEGTLTSAGLGFAASNISDSNAAEFCVRSTVLKLFNSWMVYEQNDVQFIVVKFRIYATQCRKE